MTFAPQTLRDLAAYWVSKGGVNLGIVGDAPHVSGGVSYHLGKDQLRTDAYSIQTVRDKAGLTNAASAIDLGRLGGSIVGLRKFSDWLARLCVKNQPGTRDIREVIYSPDGKMVLGFKDGIDFLIPGYGDNSHLTHTHISFYRDSEFRDKRALFRAYLEPPDTGTGAIMAFKIPPGLAVGRLVVDGPGHAYLNMATGKLTEVAAGYSKAEATGPVILPTGTVLGDTLVRRTGYLVGEDAAFFLAVDVTFTPNRTHRRSTDA